MPKKETQGRFILLCAKERQSKYKSILKDLPQEVVLMDAYEPLVRRCIESPPATILVDMVTGTRLGSIKMASLDTMNAYWPVVRCNVAADGSVNVMHHDSNKSDPLPETLDAIHRGDSSWQVSNSRGRYIRVAAQGRVRIKIKGDTAWLPGNLINLSMSGTFVLTYEPPASGVGVSLEFIDLQETPLRCEGQVVWARQWKEGPQPPGIGVEFDPSAIAPHFRQVLLEYIVDSFHHPTKHIK